MGSANKSTQDPQKHPRSAHKNRIWPKKAPDLTQKKHRISDKWIQIRIRTGSGSTSRSAWQIRNILTDPQKKIRIQIRKKVPHFWHRDPHFRDPQKKSTGARSA